MIANNGIPIRDEIELSFHLSSGSRGPQAVRFSPVEPAYGFDLW
jgi:hypothetical protein